MQNNSKLKTSLLDLNKMNIDNLNQRNFELKNNSNNKLLTNSVSILNKIKENNFNLRSKEGPLKFPIPSIPIKESSPNDESEIDYLKLILTARVYDVAIETPLQIASKLSLKLENLIYIKREGIKLFLFFLF